MDHDIETEDIFVVWNSKKKTILMATFNEELAKKVMEHFVEGMVRTNVPVYRDLEEYLDDNAEDIATEARKKLTPIEYDAIKRSVEDEYPENTEFDHEARMLYE